MATVKAIKDHHGSDGYKFANQQWEVSDEEAKGLVEAGHVTLVEEGEEKEEKKPVATKEDKTAVTTKAVGNPAVTPPAGAPTKPNEPEKPADPELKK